MDSGRELSLLYLKNNLFNNFKLPISFGNSWILLYLKSRISSDVNCPTVFGICDNEFSFIPNCFRLVKFPKNQLENDEKKVGQNNFKEFQDVICQE